ncbi:tRNA lysidine(34) synthetase TilS [Rarobacter faecitabidus]
MARITPLDPLRRAVERHLSQLEPHVPVIVACSGGADSLALAAATAQATDHLKRRGIAVTVDHGMQAGSADVAIRAARACEGLGLDEAIVATVHVPSEGHGGPEARARDARYAALDEARRKLGASAILLGHTLDDQAETVLLGLARGSGIRSIAGMAAVNDAWRRPLLSITRAQTEAVCAHLGIEPWHDPTNAGADGDPVRSRLRARALPSLIEVLGPGLTRSLARTGMLAARDADFIETCAGELVHNAREAAPDCACAPRGIRLSVKTLIAAHAAVRLRALRLAAIEAGSPAGSLAYGHCEEIDRLLTQWHGQGPIALPGNVGAARHCGTLELGTSTNPASLHTKE